MTEDKPKRAVARKLTGLDRDTIDLIRRAGGFVHIDARGNPGLETDTQMRGRHRLRRLVALGLAESSGDGLIDGMVQTYRLIRKGASDEEAQTEVPTESDGESPPGRTVQTEDRSG